MNSLALSALFIGACGADTHASESTNVPEELLTPGAEVVEFSGWEVQGLTLYTVSASEPEMTSVRIVGVDAEGGLVGGRELMQRMGELSPAELARRGMGVLLHRANDRPLMPDSDERAEFQNVWGTVTAPRVEGGKLLFYALEGEMNRVVVRHEFDLETFAQSSMQASEELRQRGQIVGSGRVVCEPVAHCFCWGECVRLEPILAPDDLGATHRRVDEPGDSAAGPNLYVRHESCIDGRCAQTCRADDADAQCDAGVLMALDVSCTETCAPSEAPFHCETSADSCRQVAHPIRTAAANAE